MRSINKAILSANHLIPCLYTPKPFVILRQSGHIDEIVFVSIFKPRNSNNKVTIVGVIMGDTNATSLFSDSRKLLASAKQGFGLVEAQPAGIDVAPPPKHRDRAPRQ